MFTAKDAKVAEVFFFFVPRSAEQKPTCGKADEIFSLAFLSKAQQF